MTDTSTKLTDIDFLQEKLDFSEITPVDFENLVFHLLDEMGFSQGESVNILLNFTQFFETRIEYRFQIFTAHSCDFLLPSYARLA